jgi:hypothetical protein
MNFIFHQKLHHVKTLSKIKIKIAKKCHRLGIIRKVTKNLSAPKESDITIASANLQIDEISDSVIVQSTWPKIFTICSENLS